MAMPAWIPEAWNRLNEDNQRQIANFMEFLLLRQDDAALASKEKKRRLGILADRFEYIADDFNAPMEDFKEYM